MSPQTVLLRTTLTRTITIYRILIIIITTIIIIIVIIIIIIIIIIRFKNYFELNVCLKKWQNYRG